MKTDGASIMGAITATRRNARFAELYSLHAQPSIRLAFLLTGNPDLAEDIAQEAFIRGISRFEDLRNRDAFGAYLRRTVVNLVRSHHRRSRVERAFIRREMSLVKRDAVDAPSVDSRDELWRALMLLAPRQRAVLVLRYYEDLSEAQTAEVLGCPVGTVKSLTSRALKALREKDQVADDA